MSQETADSASRPERPRWLGYAQLGLILIAIVVALYFARAPDRVERGATAATTAGPGKPAVRVVQPGARAYTFAVRVTGTVTLERKTKVVSQVVGRVAWVSPKFNNGGSIPANETFIRIDPTEYAIRVRAAENERSVSRWLADLLEGMCRQDDGYAIAMKQFLAVEPRRMEWIDGRKPTREELHDRAGFR